MSRTTAPRAVDSNAIEIHFETSPDGRCVRMETTQRLPPPRDQVFPFFANAMELERLTPQWLHFSVLTPAPIEMRVGTLIDYRLRVHGIPLRWRSRISVWEPPYRFVDEQLRGPYRRWYHEHLFEPSAQATVCRDLVDYEVPFGRLIEHWFVRPDIRKIFEYRNRKLQELFPPVPAAHHVATKR